MIGRRSGAEIGERARSIVLRPNAAGNGYELEILPPLDAGNFDAEFADLKRARGHALGLRMVLGIPLNDLCGPADGGR